MFKESIKACRDLLFPLACFQCQKKINSGYLCSTCQTKISFLKAPLCPGCSKPVEITKISNCCRYHKKPRPYRQVISTTEYKEPLSSLIHLFKYQHCDYLGKFLSSLMIKHLKSIGFFPQGYHYIVAVPMHRHKLKMRGYNQAGLLAGFISNHFKITLRNDIIRVSGLRPSQTKLAKLKRQSNVEGIFTASNFVKNLNFILIDDIFTTGATLSSCSQALKEKGANRITALTLSKTMSNLSKQ